MRRIWMWFKEVVHNCIIHPLMVFLPSYLATRMHDRNADWAFGEQRFDEIGLEYSGEGEEESEEKLIDSVVFKRYQLFNLEDIIFIEKVGRTSIMEVTYSSGNTIEIDCYIESDRDKCFEQLVEEVKKEKGV